LNTASLILLVSRVFFRSRVPFFAIVVNVLTSYLISLWSKHLLITYLLILLTVITSISLIYAEKTSLTSVFTGLRICGAKVNVIRGFILIYAVLLTLFLTIIQLVLLKGLLALIEFVGVFTASLTSLILVKVRFIERV